MAEQKELRRMNRTELIEIIYAQQQQEQDLRRENKELSDRLEDQTIRMESAGSIAEAALSLSHIFEDAQAAADLYLMSVKELEETEPESSDAEDDQDEDVIILWNGSSFETGDLVGFYYQNKLLLKRVIAGPGDWVDIDEEGNVYVNNELLDEPYVTEKALGETDRSYPYQVPDGKYFVMGDNRLTSIDSRSTAIGCIETDQIVGKVVLRVWPLKQMSLIR